MSSKTRNRRKLGTSSGALLAVLSAVSWARAQDPSAQPAVSASASASATVQTEPVTVSATRTTQPAVPAASALDVKLDIGLGLRTDITFDPDEDDPVDAPRYLVGYDLRPYISGQVHRNIKFEGNLDSSAHDIRVLDAVLKLEFNDYANLWLGHFLPPSDRANLSGPYYRNSYLGPNVHAYPNEFAGRDDGLAYWGQYAGGVVKWQLGFFGMSQFNAPVPGTADPRFAARVTVNVFDPEPGYYNSSTYYGTKEILAFGAVLQYEPAPEGAPDEEANALWNLDALFEKTFPGTGTLDVEGAFYGFGGADQGTSFFLLASFLFPNLVGIGQLQPMLSVQRIGLNDGDGFAGLTAPADDSASLLTIDAGLHYVISGHNARFSFAFRHTSASVADLDSVTDTDIIVGAQIQAF